MVGMWSVGGWKVVGIVDGRWSAGHLPTTFLRCSLFNITVYLLRSFSRIICLS